MKRKSVIACLPQFTNIILGCDHMGETVNESLSYQILEEYLSSGGTVLDSARSYGFVDGISHSEDIVGRFVRSNHLEKKVVVISKGGRHINPPETFIKRCAQDFEATVEQLGFTPDIWFLHRDCPELSVSEQIEGVGDFLGGTLLGLSNWSVPRFKEALALKGTRTPVISEIQFSLAPSSGLRHQDESLVCMDEENLAFYHENPVSVLCYSSQAKGYFSKILSGTPLSPKAKERFDSPVARARAERVGVLSKELCVSASEIVTSYIFSHPRISAFPIVGCSSLTQLKQSLKGGDLSLSAEQIRYLEEGV